MASWRWRSSWALAPAIRAARHPVAFLPRVLGILLIIAAVAYVAHSVTSLMLAGHRIVLYERVTMLARAAGEFPIMLWLLIKGADVHPVNSSVA